MGVEIGAVAVGGIGLWRLWAALWSSIGRIPSLVVDKGAVGKWWEPLLGRSKDSILLEWFGIVRAGSLQRLLIVLWSL